MPAIPVPVQAAAAPAVQIAFQGGGAKFVNLLAVAHAFQWAQTEGIIQITRISGTSAGSIAAALLSASADFKEVSQFISKNGRNSLQSLTKGRNYSTKIGFYWLAYNAWSGKAVFDREAFTSFLTKMFAAALKMPEESVAELILKRTVTNGVRELIITTTDLNASVARKFKSDAPLINAIADSCAIPLFFRGYRDLATNPNIDGGLCDNLPTEDLISDTINSGDVFAVTLQASKGEQSFAPYLAYFMSLFNVSIDNSVRRSRSLVNETNLITINTALGTFDFEKAFDHLYGSVSYQQIFEAAQEKILTYVSLYKTGRHRTPNIDEVYQELNTIKRSFAKIYEKMHGNNNFTIKRSTMIVTANCLDEGIDQRSRRADHVSREAVFCVGDTPIHCISVKMETDGSVTSVRPMNCSVNRVKDNHSYDIEILPVEFSSPQTSARRPVDCIIYFDHPITKEEVGDEGFIVRWSYEVADCMLPLMQNGHDELSLFNIRTSTSWQVDIILKVPKTFSANVGVICNNTDGVKELKVLDDHEISLSYGGMDTHVYHICGVRGNNVPPENRITAQFLRKNKIPAAK